MNHSMWIMMIVLLAGAMLLITASMVWHFEMHFWAVMILIAIAIAIAPMFAINRQMRAKVQEFGTLPSVPAQEVETLSRKRLKNMSWSALFAPLGGLVYLRMRPHLPPQNADDWTEIALLAALVTVFAWGALIKLRADRGGPI